MKKLFTILSFCLCFSVLTIEAKTTEKQEISSILNSDHMQLTYITEAQLLSMMSERDLSDLTDNLEGVEKTALLEEVNKDATSEINSYLLGRYDLPANASDPYITTLTKNLMKYYLYNRRDAGNIPEPIQKMYFSLVKDLEKIASGTKNIGFPKAGSTANTNSGNQNIQTANRPKTERYTLS